jgi:hypothetical protein
MELWFWILVGFMLLGLFLTTALVFLTLFAFAFISSGQLGEEDSDF